MGFDLEGGGQDAGGGDDRRARRFDVSRELGLKTTLAIHALYLNSNGLLYVIIQIDYQNQRNSPFKTHMVMKSSLAALCVYFGAAALQIKFKLAQTNNKLDVRRLLKHVLVCSGILSALSNALVFFPNMVGCIVVLLCAYATTILLVYDVFKLISNRISERSNNGNNDAAPTSGPVALEMSTEISHNAATTSSESTDMCIEISRDAATTSESTEMSIGINNNESSRNNNDAV